MVIVHDLELNDHSLDLCWYRVEIGRLTNSAIGLLWKQGSPKSPALASIRVDNEQYEISTEGMEGLTDTQRAALVKRLEEMELTPKPKPKTKDVSI